MTYAERVRRELKGYSNNSIIFIPKCIAGVPKHSQGPKLSDLQLPAEYHQERALVPQHLWV